MEGLREDLSSNKPFTLLSSLLGYFDLYKKKSLQKSQ